MKIIMGAAVALGILATPAQASCWSADEASAASVRELQSMLMVAALRCQVSGHDITADYNRFVTSNRGAIGQLNDRLKTHFYRAAGPVAGQHAYDAFVTRLANGYGAAASGSDTCDGMAALAREGSMMGGSTDGLLLLASRQGLDTALPGGVCGASTMQIASAAPSAGDEGQGSGAPNRP